MLIYGIKKYIGSYAAAMGGVDIIVFTAGIGENNNELRARVMEGMEYLGAELDPEKNAGRGAPTNKEHHDAHDYRHEVHLVALLGISIISLL